MKNFFQVSFLFLFCSFVSDNNTAFPSMSGETLDGKKVTIPLVNSGKMTLVGLAYGSNAQEALVTWYEPVYDKFVAKVGMFDKQYDINLYFVPMFVGLKQA